MCGDNAIFFSEYIEGSSNNKAIEIYNGSTNDIDLSNYSIKQANNGGAWGSFTLALSGTLAAGDVYVICHSSIAPEYSTACDLLNSTVMAYNGDDGLAIFFGSTIVDQIGVELNDPGTNWPVAGTGATSEFTLVRKSSIAQGTTDWSSSAGIDAATSEWVVYPQNTFTYLGTR
jgi:predicted extracellular nuclease